MIASTPHLNSPWLRALRELLPEPHFARYEALVEKRTLACDELVYPIGEPDGVYLVVRGSVSVGSRRWGHAQQRAASAAPGFTFGTRVGDLGRRSVSGFAPSNGALRAPYFGDFYARTESEVLVHLLPTAGLRQLLQEFPELERLFEFGSALNSALAQFLPRLHDHQSLRRMSRNSLADLLRGAEPRWYKRGEQLWDRAPEGIYLLLTGAADVNLPRPNGVVPIGSVGPGEAFGVDQAISGIPEGREVVASGPTAVAFIPQATVEAWMQTTPSMATGIIDAVCDAQAHPRYQVVILNSKVREVPADVFASLLAQALDSHGVHTLLVEGDRDPLPSIPGLDRCLVPRGERVAACLARRAPPVAHAVVLIDPTHLAEGVDALAASFHSLCTVATLGATADFDVPGTHASRSRRRDALLVGTSAAEGPVPGIGTVRLKLDLPRIRQQRVPDYASLDEGSKASIGRWGRLITDRLVGVALGGGGAPGVAHIALLRELKRRQIPVDIVAGASFGTLVGAYYVAGQLEMLVDKIKEVERAILKSWISSAFTRRVVDEHLGGARLESTPVPLHPVCTDAVYGLRTALHHGTLGEAVWASGAMPPAFTPFLRKGRRLLDGGFIDNVPTDVAQFAGAAFVVASNVVTAIPPPRDVDADPRTRLGRFLQGFNPIDRVEDILRGAFISFDGQGVTQSASANATLSPPFYSARVWDFPAAVATLPELTEALGHEFDDIEARWNAYRRDRRRAGGILK